MKRASIPASHSKALPQLDWRIPPPAMADANLGEVAPNLGEVAANLGEVAHAMADANLGEVAVRWLHDDGRQPR
jgi:hypothetical protein